MNKKLYLTLLLFAVATLSFSQQRVSLKNKFTADFTINAGVTPNTGIWGILYGSGVNYHIWDRLGASAQLHSFQSIVPFTSNASYSIGGTNSPTLYGVKRNNISNYSLMLLNLNVFGDIVVTKRNDRLRLQMGATYLRGGYVEASTMQRFDDGKAFVFETSSYVVNTIGLNAKLSYLINITDKLYVEANTALYAGGEGFLCQGEPFFDVLSFGMSVGYKF